MFNGKQVLTITNKIKSSDIGGLSKELTDRIGTGNYDTNRTKYNIEFIPLCSTNLASSTYKTLYKNNVEFNKNNKNIYLLNGCIITSGQKFFKFISVVDDLRYKCFFELLYYCGLRRSEARGLQWEHIDFKNKLLTVSQQVLNPSNSNASTEWYISSTKTEASNRTIPIATTLLNDLAELKKSNERIAKLKQT